MIIIAVAQVPQTVHVVFDNLPKDSRTNEAILVAIVGLVGVIIGGLITTVTTFVLDQKREQRERQRELRTFDIETRRAARLIDSELLFFAAAAQMCVDKKHWWDDDLQLSTDWWKQYSPVLAPLLSYNDWAALRIAVEAAENLKSFRGRATGAIPDATVMTIKPILRDINAGRAGIAPLTFDVATAPGR